MKSQLPPPTTIEPQKVREALSRHILVDGYHNVQDLSKSHGAWFYDSAKGRDVLDLYGHFSTCPLGYNHPGLDTAEFRERILPAAITKPANSDVYTTLYAEFVETFARTVPPAFRRHLFFIEGGSAAVENTLKTAFDWKVRKNLARGRGEKGTQVIHFRQAFHGRGGGRRSTSRSSPGRGSSIRSFDSPSPTR